MSVPAVSVLITVHNRAHTIGAAIRSVLAQSLNDFELVVIDDGSTDNTPDIVRGFRDGRIRLVRSPHNQGIPLARNTALAEARGRYIAWLDSDDVCHPNRLAVQYAFLEKHAEVAMVGSAARKIDAGGRLLAGGRVPVRSHQGIRALLLFRSAFQQSSIFGRAAALREIPFDPAFPVCEDVDMFVRLTDRHRAANLPQFLIARRIHGGQIIRSSTERIIDRQKAITARLLDRIALCPSDDDLRRHVVLGGGSKGPVSEELLHWGEEWVQRIQAANKRKPLYDPGALQTCCNRVLLKATVRCLEVRPAALAKIIRGLARYPRGALSLARELALPLLPFTAQPAAAGFRSVLAS